MSTQTKQFNYLNQNGDPSLTDCTQVYEEQYLNIVKARNKEKLIATSSTPITTRQTFTKSSNYNSMSAYSAPSHNVLFKTRPSKQVASFEVTKNIYGSPERETRAEGLEDNSQVGGNFKSARNFVKKIPDEFNNIELEREFENFLRSKNNGAFITRKRSPLSDSQSMEYDAVSGHFFNTELTTPFQGSKTVSSKTCYNSNNVTSSSFRQTPKVCKGSSPFYQYLSRASVYEYLERNKGKMKSARSLFNDNQVEKGSEVEPVNSPPKRIDSKGEAAPPASPLKRLEMSFVSKSLNSKKQNFTSTTSFKNLIAKEEKKLQEIIASRIIEKHIKDICSNSVNNEEQSAVMNKALIENEDSEVQKVRNNFSECERKPQREKSKKRKSLAVGHLINKQCKKKLNKASYIEQKKEKIPLPSKEEICSDHYDVKTLLKKVDILEKKCKDYEEKLFYNQYNIKNLEETCSKLRDEKEKLEKEKEFALKCYSRLETDYKKLDCDKDETIKELNNKHRKEINGQNIRVEEKSEKIRELDVYINRLNQEIKDRDNQAKQYLTLDQRLKELDDFQNKLIEENMLLKNEICNFEKRFLELSDLFKKCNEMGIKLDSIDDLIRTLEKVFTKIVRGEEPSIEMLLGYHKGRRLKLFDNEKLNDKRKFDLLENFVEKLDRMEQIHKKLQNLVSEGMDIYTSKCGENCNIT